MNHSNRDKHKKTKYIRASIHSYRSESIGLARAALMD